METHQRKVTAIPDYLKPYIVQQDASLYTHIDHASWRFIMRASKAFFARHAHQKYLDGLSETGISVDRIPLIEEMDHRLNQFGWQAVAVCGFIPPAVFMEFLSLGVLPIACDMRKLEHLAYTPAPDIVHEAAGHAPIVADPEYADYLRSYGEISRKAICSFEDLEVYHAIRNLSDTKEDPASSDESIHRAQERLDHAIAAVKYDSEATLLSRMGWWTFEYGLVGSLSQPKIYGAGLLSSLGESFHCFDSHVKKIPFSVDCTTVSYDITRPQPQLFVAPDFHTLKEGLQVLAKTMAFEKGGAEGLAKAQQARTVTTTVLETGVQVSGVLANVISTAGGTPCYLQYQGPTQISYHDVEIQGAQYHKEGFGTPLVNLSESELEQSGFTLGRRSRLEMNNGIILEGKLVDKTVRNGKLIVATFEECEVRMGTQILFRPEWGKYDMVLGQKVVSVFGGAADRKRYLEDTGGFHQSPTRQKSNRTSENRGLDILYGRVRKLREAGQTADFSEIIAELDAKYPHDWLLRLELLELGAQSEGLKTKLSEISKESVEIAEMIQRGLKLIERS